MAILKIVPDTNVWVAARWNPRSSSARILALAEEGKVILLWSAETRRELERILGNVKASLGYRAYVGRLLGYGMDVGETEQLDVIVDDPDDNKFLACARKGDADYIITNDEHLLVLQIFDGTKIITPGQFMERFAEVH